MAGDDGLLRITTFDAVAHRGRRLAGTVQIDGERDVRGLRAELVRTQVSISAPVPQVDVVAQQEIVGATHLTPGQTHTFWIDVPDDAVPGFTTPNGTLMWSLRVRADVLGSDPMCNEPVTIAPIPGDRPAAGLLTDAAVTEIVAATRKRTESAQRNALVMGVIFALGAVVFVGIGLFGILGEHPTSSRIVSFGLAAFFAGMAWLVLGLGVRRSRGVSATTDADVYRPGATVIATAHNPTSSSCSIALQEIEVRMRVTDSGKQRRVDAPQEELAADWRELPPGDHRMTFTVRPDALGSFGGRTIAVVHRVVVVMPGKQGGSRRPLHEHHIVVIR